MLVEHPTGTSVQHTSECWGSMRTYASSPYSLRRTSDHESCEVQVLQRLQRPDFRAACPSTRVLLAPSTRDAAAVPVFPQPPLTPAPGLAAQGVTWLPNPATFQLNEVRVIWTHP